MALPRRIEERIRNYTWPVQVGQTRVISPYSFGRGTIERTFRYPSSEYPGYRDMAFQLWDGSPPKDRASIVLPITTEGHVVIVVQYCHAVGKPVVEIPGGVPRTETDSDSDTAIREVQEETGFTVGLLVDLGFLYWEPHYKTLAFHAFLALNCKRTETTADLEGAESLLVETLTWSEWMEICRDPGLVRDSKSIAVTFLATEHLKLLGR